MDRVVPCPAARLCWRVGVAFSCRALTGAMAAQDGRELVAVDQATPIVGHGGDRRMVQEHDAAAFGRQPVEHGRERSELAPPEPAGGEGRRGRHRGREPDHGDVAAPAQEGERLLAAAGAGIAAHIVRPVRPGLVPLHLDVGVVVARDHRDPGGAQAEPIEARARERELLTQRQVGDVAGAQHVVDAGGVEILDHVVERVDVVVPAAVRQQVHRADPALVRELEPARAVVRQQVQIGAVGQAHARGQW